jgi:hypothetical protein
MRISNVAIIAFSLLKAAVLFRYGFARRMPVFSDNHGMASDASPTCSSYRKDVFMKHLPSVDRATIRQRSFESPMVALWCGRGGKANRVARWC